MDISRETRTISLALTNSANTTPVLDYQGCVSGEVHLPATAAVLLTWYSCSTSNGTFVAAYDSAASPAAVTQTVVQSRAYPIPIALAGCKYLKCVSDVAMTVDITLKT